MSETRLQSAPRNAFAALLVTFCTAFLTVDAARAVAVGETLPEAAGAISLTNLHGGTGSLASLWRTNGALVVFVANTCPYVIDWLDRLPDLAARADEHDVTFLVVNANERRRKSDDAPDAMRALAETHGFTFPYWIDADAQLADALGATRTPEVFLFSGAGALVYHGALDDHSGPLENVSHHWTRDALAQMLAGEVIATPSIQPIGCAVQRPRRRRPNNE